MKTIRLGGKYAVGAHEFAIVDDEDFERLSQWAWKAKPNGSNNHVYAVRSHKGKDGKTRTVRMHRSVLRYSGPLDVDHINRNALDNRRQNLRVVTRKINAANTVYEDRSTSCAHCCAPFTHRCRIGGKTAMYCSKSCVNKAAIQRSRLMAPPREPLLNDCAWCQIAFDPVKPAQRFCCEKCRKAEKWARQRASGTLPPSANGHVPN